MVQKKAFDYLDAPIIRVMGGDVPLPYAPTLIEAYLPNPQKKRSGFKSRFSVILVSQVLLKATCL